MRPCSVFTHSISRSVKTIAAKLLSSFHCLQYGSSGKLGGGGEGGGGGREGGERV